MDNINLEKYSSAFTLSDLELFIFPDLFTALTLSNIMSENIWKWLSDPFFKNIENLSQYKKICKIRQYIIEHYIFSLNLETWGVCDFNIESERFNNYIDKNTLCKSNAFFCGEKQTPYFDLNTRLYFNLEKYDSNIIPIFKTETISMMDGFKNVFLKSMGECVSLSSLYIASLFIIAKIPLDDMFNISTPLHSQNFILTDNECYITNNRRLITKSMWFNNSENSFKAHRALKNETISSIHNINGYIHNIYNDFTLPVDNYKDFKNKLLSFLTIGNEQDIIPKLPLIQNKTFLNNYNPIKLDIKMTRSEIIDYLLKIRSNNETVDLAFYCYRDLDYIENLEPFYKAAFERNPVSIDFFKNMTKHEIINYIDNNFKKESIYGSNSLATPDEVFNAKSCNIFEKNILLQNIFQNL